MKSLAYLHGEPTISGEFKSNPADFCVTEILPFELTGEGEHLFLYVEKIGENTAYVARKIADFFKVSPKLVSYAGLKDRHAVTRQWFSVHLPGKDTPDLSAFAFDGVKLLNSTRHNKKLKTGVLRGNRFEISLRNVSCVDSFVSRWNAICKQGVPNYYGEQRFGHDGNNIDKALAMFSGKRIKDRNKRSIYLSAARSYLFNLTLDKRISDGAFNCIEIGDVMMLSGSQSIFVVDEIDDSIQKRLDNFDVDLTCALWGRGELKSAHATAQRERDIALSNKEIALGIENAGLKQERKRIRLVVESPNIETKDGVCKVSFELPAGCFATSVLRELGNFKDLSQSARTDEEKES